MNTPRELIDSLESIIGILFSDIKHKERSVFILCDNLVELCCKAKIKEKNPFDTTRRDFYASLADSCVPKKLAQSLGKMHLIRNDMQHKQAFTTVSFNQCSDFIIEILRIIKKFWGKYAFSHIDEWLGCSLKVIHLYSSKGRAKERGKFEEFIFNDLDYRNADIETISYTSNDEIDYSLVHNKSNRILSMKDRKRFPERHEIVITANSKDNLGLLIKEFTPMISNILEELEINYEIQI